MVKINHDKVVGKLSDIKNDAFLFFGERMTLDINIRIRCGVKHPTYDYTDIVFRRVRQTITDETN